MSVIDQPVLEVPQVPLEEIHHHPLNPRRNAVADEEMVDSVAVVGVLDPLMVAPAVDGNGWVLIDGHRRDDAARRAGLRTVPVNPRYDLVTEAQQVEVMVITGLQKELLTPVEEAAGYEQLALLGFDAAAIAASTGFSQARVKSRMKLNSLGAAVRDKVHAGQLTIGDAEAFLEFADNPELVAELEEVAGTNNFRWKVEDARQARKRAAHQHELIEEFEAAGALETEETDYRRLMAFTEELDTPDAHDGGDDGCLRWVFRNTFGSYGDPFLVCIDAKRHGIEPAGSSTPVTLESEWEKQRAERAEALARAQAAAAVRTAWLVDHLTKLFPAKGHQPLALLAAPLVSMLLRDDREAVTSTVIAQAFGIDVNAADGYQQRHAVLRAAANTIAAAKPTQALSNFARYVAALIADQLDTDTDYLATTDDALAALALWDWLIAAGYPMSDVDTECRSDIAQRLADLDAEDGDDA